MVTTRTSAKSKGNGQSRARTRKAGEDCAHRDEHIAIAAYYKAEARNFAPGYEMEDWLAAEVELSSH